MLHRVKFLIKRLRERLWVRPLGMALLSITLVFLAELADGTGLRDLVPKVNIESLLRLLEILSASMLVIATFSVASMVAAYSAAAVTATPRSFVLVVADDASQKALSRFIGAFIFSVIALIAMQNNYYERAGIFVLFLVTLGFFLLVIVTFVLWVDRIARLGRISNTLDKVERATFEALDWRRRARHVITPGIGVGGTPPTDVKACKVGYLQRVDLDALQDFAAQQDLRIDVAVSPGAYIGPGELLARLAAGAKSGQSLKTERVRDAFAIGVNRSFDNDPRFGVIVLSEIASRALSPAVNDPGTAIDVIGRLVRLFATTIEPLRDGESTGAACDRVSMPEVVMADLFDDAFNAIARDGASIVEVLLRLQKALATLAGLGDAAMREAALRHARWALARAEGGLTLPEDLVRVRASTPFAAPD